MRIRQLTYQPRASFQSLLSGKLGFCICIRICAVSGRTAEMAGKPRHRSLFPHLLDDAPVLIDHGDPTLAMHSNIRYSRHPLQVRLRAKRIHKPEEVREIDPAVAVEVKPGVSAAVRIGKQEKIHEIGPAVAVEIG